MLSSLEHRTKPRRMVAMWNREEFDTSAHSCLVGFVQCSIAKWVLISFHVFRTYESQSLNSATSLLRGASRSVGVSGVVLIRRRSEWNSLVIKIEKSAYRGRDCFSSSIYSGFISIMKGMSIRFYVLEQCADDDVLKDERSSQDCSHLRIRHKSISVQYHALLSGKMVMRTLSELSTFLRWGVSLWTTKWHVVSDTSRICMIERKG